VKPARCSKITHLACPHFPFHRAIEIKPDFHEAWNNKGVSLEKLGKKKAAQKAFKKAEEILKGN
jgi:Flp pilus assembly protein TadD